MFYFNASYQNRCLGNMSEISQVLFLPSEKDLYALEKSTMDNCRFFVDPQIYLSRISPEECTPACSRLVTYPWFGAKKLPDASLGISKWRENIKSNINHIWNPKNTRDPHKCCYESFEFQNNKEYDLITVPAPLISEKFEIGSMYSTWIDTALQVSQEVGNEKPLILTIALDEKLISSNDSDYFSIFDTLIDIVASRLDDGISGVYILFNQSTYKHPYRTPSRILKSYLYLTKSFSELGLEYIFINFADVFSLACLGLGATGFAIGRTRKTRILSLENYINQGGGQSYPLFFSPYILAEIPTRPFILEEFTKRYLYKHVFNVTSHSNYLYNVLKNKGDCSAILGWEYSQNNTVNSHKHFLSSVCQLSKTISSQSNTERAEYVYCWLQDCQKNQKWVRDKLGDTIESKIKFIDIDLWLSLIDEVSSMS